MAPLRKNRRRTWLVTGAAGFIGSHLVEQLLCMGQNVVSLDNFATGHRATLRELEQAVGPQAWRGHHLIEASIEDADACRFACHGVDIVLHHAALGSVPRSIADPVHTHRTNVTGFLNMLMAARDTEVRRFVYASSSSAYGNDEGLPKMEDRTGAPLSPYAASKQANELYAEAFARCYGMETIGLRYFNVFGPRQDPEGAYAAVIPRWIRAILAGAPVEVNGDGESSRDFCYVDNVVQANLLAAITDNPRALNQVYNIAVGENTSLNGLLELLCSLLGMEVEPVYRPFRHGDVRHSLADISRARELLGYQPTHTLSSGLRDAVSWYVNRFAGAPALQR